MSFINDTHLSPSALLIMGFGGHARSVADVALACGYDELCFMDENAKEDERFLHFLVLKDVPLKAWSCVLAAGNNHRRAEQMKEAEARGWIIQTLISPRASQGVGSHIGMGNVIGHHAHVGPMAAIGHACIINTGAVVEHDCYIGDFCHVSVNATLCGQVVLGRRVFIGAGAIVRNGVTLVDDVMIGAGAVVVADINQPGTYIGTPARLIKPLINNA